MRYLIAFVLVVALTANVAPAGAGELPGTVTAALAMEVDVNAGAEDVYDLVLDMSRASGIPIVLTSSVRHVPAGLTLGTVTLQTALTALCNRFGWTTHLSEQGMLVLGPAADMGKQFGDSALQLGAPETTVKIVHLHYRQPSEELTALLKNNTLMVHASPDDNSHTVILQGAPGSVAEFAALVQQEDVPLSAVELKVTVYDYTPVNEQGAVGGSLGGLNIGGASGTGGGSTSSGGTGGAFYGNAVQINASFSAQVSSGHARVVSSPDLRGLDNQPQKVQLSDSFFLNPVGGGLGPAVQAQRIDTGVIGNMVPHVGRGFVTVEADMQVSDIGPILAGNPTVIAQHVVEQLRIRDGDAAVIGGLMRDSDTDTLTRIPLLSYLPLLGAFFREKITNHVKNQIVFVIEPVIMPAIKESGDPALTGDR